MNIFHNRPLALACSVAALCVTLSVLLAGSWKMLLAVLLLTATAVLACIMLLRRAARRLFPTVLCLALAGAAFLSSYLYFDVQCKAYQKYQNRSVCAEGLVLDRLDGDAFYSSLQVELTSLDGDPCSAKARLSCSYPTALQTGDRFSVTVTPTDPNGSEQVPFLSSFWSDGNQLLLCADDPDSEEITGTDARDLRVFASRLNLRLSCLLHERIGGDAGGLAAALLLGDRSFLGDFYDLQFRRAGVTHLIAISGLHLSVLIGFVDKLLRLLRTPSAIRMIFVPGAAFAYLILTGFLASAWRAVLMMCALYLGSMLRLRYDSLTTLCASLAGLTLITPYSVYDPAMWLSFLSAASIIVFAPAVTDWLLEWKHQNEIGNRTFRVVRAAVVAVSTGVFANLALLLYSAYLFGEISLLAVPATLLLSVPITVLLFASAWLLFLPFLPFLPEVCLFLGDLTLWMTDFSATFPSVLMPATSWPVRLCLFALTAVLIFLAVAKLEKKRWAIPIPALLVLTLIVSAAVTHSAEGSLAIPAGTGKVYLYASRGTATVINDTSGNSTEVYILHAEMQNFQCTEIQDLYFTDYYNQGTYFISRIAAEVTVRNIHLPYPNTPSERAIADRLVGEAARFSIPVYFDG